MTILGELVDHLRNCIPYSILVIFPILIIVSPIDPIKAAQDFTVYRMQQYDYQGVKIGSRSAVFNFEAQTLGAKILTRKCLVLKLMETTMGLIRQAISQNVGGILIILPGRDSWTESLREHLVSLERELLSDEYPVPILFAEEDDTVRHVYTSVQHMVDSGQAASAAAALVNAVWSSGYQLYLPSGASKPLPDHEIVNIHGKLVGAGLEEQLPTVMVVAHYDAFGIAPSLAFGADSNGSGVITLLTLVRIFSRLYTMSRTHAKHNLVFLLSGGGKFNYMGTKKWLEEHAEVGEGGLLSEVSLVVCLEGLASGDALHMHVSKPPREGSSGHAFLNHLTQAAQAITGEGEPRKVELTHKKINLNEDFLAWEHERYSIRKLPGVTLSHFSSPSDPLRRSILDRHTDNRVLTENTRVIAEALIRFLYNTTDVPAEETMVPEEWVSPGSISQMEELLSRYSRSAQALPKGHRLLGSLEKVMRNHLQDVKVTAVKADKRDPEFLFYDGLDFIMSAHKVKPAVFEFILACGIALYLGVVYLVIEHFYIVRSTFASIFSNGSGKQKVM